MSASNADLSLADSSRGDSSETGSPDTRESHGHPAVEVATPGAVITECDLPDAPEKVWRALTVPELLVGWLPEALESEIVEAEPNRLLRYRWSGGEHDKDAAGRPVESVVSFELTGAEDGGTHLRVVHRPLIDETVVAVERKVLEETATAVEPSIAVLEETAVPSDQAITPLRGRIVCLASRMRAVRKPAVAMGCFQTSMRRAA